MRTTDQLVDVAAEADGTPVQLDTRLYLPAGSSPRPAVLLAHGFGGSKESVDQEARRYAADGNVVLTFTARGFGRSGGSIHLNSPDFEIADGRVLLDLLASRPEVRRDGAGDPRVAVAGGSYGGAFTLMLAGSDPRVDATVAAITWNDLSSALFPQGARGSSTPGPYKQLWGARFFGASVGGDLGLTGATGATGAAGTTGASGGVAAAAVPSDLLCGRFEVSLCRQLQDAAENGRPSAALTATLRRNSPEPSLAKVTAPTLLVQGEADTLFGLDQADANAAGLAAAGTRHAVRWSDGGHDGASSNPGLDEEAARTWVRTYLAGTADRPAAGARLHLLAARSRAAPTPRPSRPSTPTRGCAAAKSGVSLRAPQEPSVLLTPPGGQPSSMTSIPGLGATELPTYRLAALPGMSAAFDSAVLDRSLTVVGSPSVQLSVTSTGTEATLFVSLWRVQGSDAVQQRALTTPVRVALTPGGGHRCHRGPPGLGVVDGRRAASGGCSSPRPTARSPHRARPGPTGSPSPHRCSPSPPPRAGSSRRRPSATPESIALAAAHRRPARRHRRAPRSCAADAATARRCATTSPTSRSSWTGSSRPTPTATGPSTTSPGAPSAARSSACSDPTAPARRRPCG